MSHCGRNILLTIVLGATIFALGACSRPSLQSRGSEEFSFTGGYEGPDRPSAEAGRFRQLQLAQARGEPLTTGQGAKAGPAKRVAVSHSFTLELPDTDIEAVHRRHLSECGKLGCTIISTMLDRSHSRRISARSEVRIAPDAFPAFADILAAPPARIVTHSESADDKTAPMLDVEKRLEVKSALRDRLSAILREPGTKSPADLITIEKELAQVQGDIESTVAQLDYLRTITDTVHVVVTYDGIAAEAAGLDLSPLVRAVTNVGSTLVWSAANLTSFLAAILPWLPLVALVGWGVRRAIRRWRSARSAAA
jgi:hypothetical protein